MPARQSTVGDKFVNVLAVMADVIAVVGWLTGDQTTLLLVGAALALVLGLVLIARQWGKALGMPAVIGLSSVVVGVVLGAVAVIMLTGPQPTPTPDSHPASGVHDEQIPRRP